MDARKAEILKALRVFIPDGQVVELRAFPPGRGNAALESTLYRDMNDLADRALHLEDRTNATGCYFTPNKPVDGLLVPKQKSKKKSLNADLIERRHWLLIDADPARFDEYGQQLEGDAADIPSTEEEHANAWEVIASSRSLLESFGFVGAVVADSGNGWHLCYPVDLPADQASYDLHSELLAGLEMRCGNEFAHIDQKPKDAPRIWKLYGTLARKGIPTETRPYRRAWLVEGEPPTQEQREANNAALVTLIDIWRRQDPPKKVAKVATDTVSRARAYIDKEEPAVSGQNGHARCYHVACILKWGFALSDSEAFSAIAPWNARCNPPWSDSELQHKFDQAVKDTRHKEPYGHLRDEQKQSSANGKHTANGQATGSKAKSVEKATSSQIWRVVLDDETILEGDPESVLADTEDEQESNLRVFEMRTMGSLRRKTFIEPNWIVPGIVSEGLNILAGAPKQGKSMLALNLALTVAGGGMALGNVKVQPFDVIYLSLEDKQRRVRSRADKMLQAIDFDLAAGIDNRLTIATEWPTQQEGGLRLLDLWCKRAHAPGLVIIDVLGQFAPPKQTSGSAYAQDYAYVSKIKKFADRHGLTVLLIHHTRKQSTIMEAADYLQEVSGTLGITGAADGIMVLLKSRQDNQASLHITGRDVVERELVLEFDVNTLTWKSIGTAAEHVEGRVRKAIVQYLRSLNGESAFASDIISAIGEKENSVRQALGRLRAEKIIRKVGNAWAFPGEADEACDSWTP